METNLKTWFKIEIKFEGGKVDHPKDPGGRTNMGVTQRVYDGYRRARKLARQDVYNITPAEVLDIYKTGYWDKVWGDRLPDGLDVVVADGAINSGVAQSVKWLQRALGSVRVDGIMGDATLTAAVATNDIDALIARVIEIRNRFLRALKTFKTFGKGWLSRTRQLLDVGQHLGRGSVGPAPVLTFAPNMNRKASLEDAKAPPPKLDAVWGAGVSGGALAQGIEALSPFQQIERVATLIAIITAVGSFLAIAGGVWAWYARRRTNRLSEDLGIRPSTPANDNQEVPEGMMDELDRDAA